MPICIQGHAGCEPTETLCPSCGVSTSSTAARCGRLAMGSLWFAWAAALISAMGALIGGAVAVVLGQWWTGLLLIFISAPVNFGMHVALGLAIR
jgi:hypothetical protein